MEPIKTVGGTENGDAIIATIGGDSAGAAAWCRIGLLTILFLLPVPFFDP